jgi:hypothetical protein
MTKNYLEALEYRHQQLDDQVDEMNARRYLSPMESTRLREMKMLRLQLKRMITELQTDVLEN